MKKALVAALLFFAGAAHATSMDTLTLSNGKTYAQISILSPANGTVQYCTDCAVVNPCTGSGSGAVAKREGGAWNCGTSSGLTSIANNTVLGNTSGSTALPTAQTAPVLSGLVTAGGGFSNVIGATNGSGDNAAAIASALSSSGVVSLASGLYPVATGLTSMNTRIWSPSGGQVQTSSGTVYHAPFAVFMNTVPSSWPTCSGLTNCFNADLSRTFAFEQNIEGTATLTQPNGTAGHEYFRALSAALFYIVGRNNSGWNQSTTTNNGRTGGQTIYMAGFNPGQGDYKSIFFDWTVSGNKGGCISFLCNAAGGAIGGQFFATADGVFLQGMGDFLFDDNTTRDIAVNGITMNFDRHIATGAKNATWTFINMQNKGPVEGDSGLRLSQEFTMALDASHISFPSKTLATITRNAAGTGYVVGDEVCAAGGTQTQKLCVQIMAIGGGGSVGAVQGTDWNVTRHGQYTVLPTLTGNAFTGGTGSGLTFDFTLDSGALIAAPTGSFWFGDAKNEPGVAGVWGTHFSSTTELGTAKFGYDSGSWIATNGFNVQSGTTNLSGNISAASWTTAGIGLKSTAATYTCTTCTGTITSVAAHGLAAPTLAASSATTYTNASTLVLFPPVAGANVTITSPRALDVQGAARVVGTMAVTGALNVNASNNATASINTGTSTGAIALGGGSNTVAINSSAWDIDATGAASGLTTLNTSGLVTGGGGFSANSQKITAVADPVAGTDAVNLQTMTAAVEGRKNKNPALYTTTGNVTLSGLGTQGNGEWPSTLTDNDVILAKDQTTSADKGLYNVHSGAWVRTADADTGAEITNASVLVKGGTSIGDTFTQVNTVTTIGTDPQSWVQTGSGATYTADESTLTLTGFQYSEKDGGTTNAKLANMAQSTFKMRAAGAGTGVPIDGTAAQAKTALAIACADVTDASASCATDATNANNISSGTLGAARLPAFGSGDVSFAAAGGAGTIASSAVTNAKLANVANNTLKGNTSGSTAAPSDQSLGTVQTTFVAPDGSTLEYSSNVLRQKDAGTTNAKLANMANGTVKCRTTAGTGVPEDCTTLPTAAEPAHTGDVTNSAGSLALTLANIPTATPMAGSLLAAAIVAPGTPAAGKGSVYVDSTSKNIAVKDDAGVVKHGVQTVTSTASQWISAINDAGAGTKSQPAFSDVSGSATCPQLPALTGGVTTSAGSCATTVAVAPTTALTGALQAAQFPALTSDVTTSAGSLATTIAANAVTNAKAAQMAAHTFKGNNTGSTANALDLTQAQLTADLNLATTSLQGMMSADDKRKSTGCSLSADVTTSGTAAFTLLSCQIDANTVAVGDTFHLNVAGVTAALGNPTWSIAIGTANPGTTVTWTTAAMTSGSAAGGGIDAICTVKSIGAGGTMTCAGRGFVLALVASSATATAQSINTTVNWFITARVAMSASTFRATGAFIKKM